MSADLAELRQAFAAGRSGEARTLFAAALERHRSDPDALLALAAVAEAAGIGDLALRTAHAARRLDGGRADLHRRVGDLCRALGRCVEADDAYRQALAIDPADAAAAAGLAAVEAGTVAIAGLGQVRFRLGAGVVRLQPEAASRRALVSFFRAPVLLAETDPALGYQSVYLDSREVCRLLLGRGFAVDLLDTGSEATPPDRDYDLVFGLHDDLVRHRTSARSGALRIQWMTGRHPEFQNAAERARIEDLVRRRGGAYAPKRQIERVEGELAAIDLADRGILIGNRATLATYPAEWQAKIALIPVCAGRIQAPKPRHRLVPPAREFLWLNSFGAVLKGLDRAIEAVLADERLVLNIVGLVDQEADFLAIYGEALAGHPRIRTHGYIATDSRRFADIADRSAAFLLPSASEGMSGSAATCLQVGLYPIVSRESGIDLPAGAGRMLETSSVEEIGRAMAEVIEMPADALAAATATCQRVALALYSRPATTRRLEGLFDQIIG
jgi:tetratricopeptide (TPR) repeat protein